MSLIGDALAAGVGLAARFLRLKRVTLPPKLVGPTHLYPDEMTLGVTYYAMHCCTKCTKFNANRAAYTAPPCTEKPPTVIVELP